MPALLGWICWLWLQISLILLFLWVKEAWDPGRGPNSVCIPWPCHVDKSQVYQKPMDLLIWCGGDGIELEAAGSLTSRGRYRRAEISLFPCSIFFLVIVLFLAIKGKESMVKCCLRTWVFKFMYTVGLWIKPPTVRLEFSYPFSFHRSFHFSQNSCTMPCQNVRDVPCWLCACTWCR